MRGQQLNSNTQDKSVSASSSKSKGSKSKASDQRKSRQDGYKKKFGNRPHMIIPQEDSEFIETQTATVMRLWHQCWRADPYGSQEMQLNHTLTYKSFMRAKKVIEKAGMFTFRPEKSKLNHKETICWKIQNLHGARRNDFWLKSEGQQSPSEGQQSPSEGQQSPSEGQHCPSENSEVQSQQAIPNPSETSQERLRNSSKELLETLATEKGVSDRDRDVALEEQITSASLPNENQVQSLHSFHCVPVVPDCLEKKEEANSLGAACPQTPRGQMGKEINTPPNEEILNQEYIPNPQSEEAVVRSVGQNLAIDDQRTTKEYQTTSKEAFDRMRAITGELKQKKKHNRFARLRGDSPMSLSERQAFEQYKQEVETNRKKQTEEELVDFWDF